MVTIKMIAKVCGFSVATVSKALNGAPDVSDETRQRIRECAAELGYLPNTAARMLKTSRSYNIGVLFEDSANRGLTHAFFSRILNAFKHRCEDLGYDLTFISERMGGREVSYVEHARSRNCDGVIIASVDYRDEGVQDLINSGIPIVTIDYEAWNCGSVCSDNVGGVSQLVRYVYDLGHRKIAFIHGDDTAVTALRVAAFCRTCKELGLALPEEYLVPSLYTNPEMCATATRKLLELPDPPTCIFYPDDIAFIGGRNEAERMGLSIPDSFSAVGFDGVDVVQMMRPQLTTMRQDAETMGIRAAEELVRAIEEGRSYLPGRILIPCQLVEGKTVGKP